MLYRWMSAFATEKCASLNEVQMTPIRLFAKLGGALPLLGGKTKEFVELPFRF